MIHCIYDISSIDNIKFHLMIKTNDNLFLENISKYLERIFILHHP